MEFAIAIIIGLLWGATRNQKAAMEQQQRLHPPPRRNPLHEHDGVWHEHAHDGIHLHHPQTGEFKYVAEEHRGAIISMHWPTGTYTVLPEEAELHDDTERHLP